MTQKEIIRNKPDIVHAHSSFAGFVVRMSPALLVTTAKIVYCAHGWSFLMDFTPWRRRIYAAIEWALCGWTNSIINISQTELDGAIGAGLPRTKQFLVHSGIAVNDGDVDLAASPDLHDPEQEHARIELLYVGRFDHAKGFDILLEAMRRLEDKPLHLTVCGEAVHEQREFLTPANVSLAGWIQRRALKDYYKKVDAVIIPSRSEGFGLVAIEAMRAGKAVIASNRGALAEIVLHRHTGDIFDLNDLDGLVQLLGHIDRDDLREQGQAGRKRFVEFFTAERMERETHSVYLQTLDSTNGHET